MPRSKTAGAPVAAPAPVVKPEPEHERAQGVPPRAPPKKRPGLRQLRVSIENVPHNAAMNSEGVWLKEVNGKKGKNNRWRFAGWDEVLKVTGHVDFEPTGDNE